MKELLMYACQVNVALLLFYLLYRLLFARDTFCQVKRFVLLSFLVWAFGYPCLDFPASLEGDWPVVLQGYATTIQDISARSVPAVSVSDIPASAEVDGRVGWVLLAGLVSAVLFLRFLGQCWQIGRLIRRSQSLEWKGHRLRVLPSGESPFSFFHWVFVCPSDYTSEQLEEILVHEEVHVRQKHTWDVLLSQWVSILCWYNPVSWLLQQAVRENLEFLADAEVIRRGYNRKDYQYHLLLLSSASGHPNALINPFNVSPLKKRIMMMNKQRTGKSRLWKYALILPVAGALLGFAHLPALAGVAETNLGMQQTNQKYIVKGKVVDEHGKPVHGASIVVKGTPLGAMSDREGNFQVEVQRPGTLCISFIGRITQQISFECDGKLLTATLYTENNELDRVVVVAYAAKKETAKAPAKTAAAAEDLIYFVAVEEMPSFNGNLYEYLGKNLRYPTKSVESYEEGTVYVSFIIDTTGEVKSPTIVQSVSPDLDAEALRIVRAMPKWKPGKQRNQPVKVLYTLPIDFKLQTSK